MSPTPQCAAIHPYFGVCVWGGGADRIIAFGPFLVMADLVLRRAVVLSAIQCLSKPVEWVPE